MVAEERRKRAEAEEAIKEVKEEREALRETIKVLGGKVDDASSRASTVDDEEEAGSDENSFAPRDLDKHYEALRKTIHHVGEGIGGDEVDQVMSGIGVIPDVGGPGIMPILNEVNRSGLEMVPSIAPLSPNPWASAEPFNLPPQPAVPTLRVIEGTPQESISRSGAEEIGQVEVGKNESRSQVEELDRLMERLQQEAKD
ncbi:hypothetical protein TREMEDRAFT_70790 [Tremella mesenterica DSM 1558]|uniref:uncharacterized protein n=1 Tax=Tremella mesenterica (strain ATCC 24925 / CBS 8224 / DSM 1558 / NBRC 9311 / NRRL Y-6157 / RJB 2259-6 / UBC 559-6) TaxID=578456 RepID=UPI0003F49B2C|nr:uncharacterized protein TREMEDRAFT_70790 [Tremella mesenterica DSM 1558]EIW72694.1 hypothetical protein TREMEDRAFT_70790 [Tremella mesenterica DSM 1558]